MLNSQTNTSDSIQAWASHLATVTSELQTHDQAVAGLIANGSSDATDESSEASLKRQVLGAASPSSSSWTRLPATVETRLAIAG